MRNSKTGASGRFRFRAHASSSPSLFGFAQVVIEAAGHQIVMESQAQAQHGRPMDTAVGQLETLFQKAEGDLSYVKRKLETEFDRKWADAGLEKVIFS